MSEHKSFHFVYPDFTLPGPEYQVQGMAGGLKLYLAKFCKTSPKYPPLSCIRTAQQSNENMTLL